MSFSERMGIKAVRAVIQVDAIDDPLRNGLWDCLHLIVWKAHENRHDYDGVEGANLEVIINRIWHQFFHLPIDSIPESMRETVAQIRRAFFDMPWSDCYDFVEFIAGVVPDQMRDSLVKMANVVLERNMSGYRFVDDELTPITSEQEIESIESAIGNSSLSSGVRAHFKAALQKLSDRVAPDHRNSIKESISAVEAACQVMTGNSKATLGQALKNLEDQGAIHPALKSALSSLYGYTSDADGIRHAMLEESSLTFADSKFMLVACTAFVNYIFDKSRKV